MTFIDYFLMAAVLAGAGYLLYRSAFKNKSGCGSCEVSSCNSKSLKYSRK